MSSLSPKERAITVVIDHGLAVEGVGAEIARSIEQAIIAAVDEDRATRDCCEAAAKRERAAWQMKCANETRRMMDLAQYCKQTGDPAAADRYYLAAAAIDRIPEARPAPSFLGGRTSPLA